MSTVPNPATKSVANKLTASGWNADVRDEATFWTLTRPYAVLTQSAAQAGFASGTTNSTAVIWDTETLDRDPLGQHDNVTNPTRILIGKTLGWYEVGYHIAWPNNATGERRAIIRVNGSTDVAGSLTIYAAQASQLSCAMPGYPVQATASADYIEIYLAQSSGGTLAPTVGTTFRSFVTVKWMGS